MVLSRSRSIPLTALTTTLLVRASPFTLKNWLISRGVAKREFSKTLAEHAEESFDDILQDVLDLETHEGSVVESGWRKIDWASTVAADSADSQDPFIRYRHAPSPVDSIVVRDRIVYIKRDDQLRLKGSQISGNKARKMYALNQIPPDEFPSCIVSYGGPQSNAMLAIAAVVRHKNDSAVHQRPMRFVYYTRTLPRFLRRQPTGNLYRALSLGMELIQVSSQEYHNLFGSDWGGSDEPPIGMDPPVPGDSVWVPQGGACAMATVGLDNLATEICDYWAQKTRSEAPVTVVLPGGTGATALLLNQAIQQRSKKQSLDIKVVVIPCVGDAEYAMRQMLHLSKIVNGSNATKQELPTILPASPKPGEPYFSFGEPHTDLLDTYQEMEEEHDLTLDLLYGAAAWAVLFRHWPVLGFTSESTQVLQNRQLMYIHTGGLEGLGTQLLRYKYKGLLASREVQLPYGILQSRTGKEPGE